MRTLNRNKQWIAYALLEGKREIMDGERHTGQYELLFTEPRLIKVSVSSARGAADTELFGVAEQYDKVIILDDKTRSLGISETSRIWIDTLPDPFWDDETPPFDYAVTRVASGLNHTTLAVRKVDVRHG